MQDFIGDLLDFFWKNAENFILMNGHYPPLLQGFEYRRENSVYLQDLVDFIPEKDWSDPDRRFETYLEAFQKRREANLPGFVSISESLLTVVNSEELDNLGFPIDNLQELKNLQKDFPGLFEKCEALTIYLEYKNTARLTWARIFRTDSIVNHLSEYVECTGNQIDGLLRNARNIVYKASG